MLYRFSVRWKTNLANPRSEWSITESVGSDLDAVWPSWLSDGAVQESGCSWAVHSHHRGSVLLLLAPAYKG